MTRKSEHGEQKNVPSELNLSEILNAFGNNSHAEGRILEDIDNMLNVADEVNLDNKQTNKIIEQEVIENTLANLTWSDKVNVLADVGKYQGYANPQQAAVRQESAKPAAENEDFKVKIRSLFVAERSIEAFDNPWISYSNKKSSSLDLFLFGTHRNSKNSTSASSFFANLFKSL